MQEKESCQDCTEEPRELECCSTEFTPSNKDLIETVGDNLKRLSDFDLVNKQK